MLVQLIVEIAIGALCGYAATRIMKANSKSIVFNIIVGIIGGFVGGLIGNLIGISGGWLTGILLSIGGGCLVIWACRKLLK